MNVEPNGQLGEMVFSQRKSGRYSEVEKDGRECWVDN